MSSGLPSPRRGPGSARRCGARRSGRAICDPRAACRRRAGAGRQASRRAGRRPRRDRRGSVLDSNADLAGVVPVRLDDVADHLVAVAAAAARALAELGGRAGGDAVERRPGGFDDGGQPLRLSGGDGPRVGIGDAARDAELGAGAAFLAFDDVDVDARREVEPGGLRDRRVSRRIREQRLDRQLLGLAGADQPGQSSADAKTFFGRASRATASDPIGSGSRGAGSAGLPERAHERWPARRRPGRPRRARRRAPRRRSRRPRRPSRAPGRAPAG